MEVSSRLDIARAVSSSSNVDIVECKVRAATISTKDIIISSFGLSSAEDVGHGDVLDDDTVRRASSWASIEVVLLNVDTVDVDIGDLDVTILDVGNVASRAGVGLDSCTILAVEHFAVLEPDVGDVIVALREVRMMSLNKR